MTGILALLGFMSVQYVGHITLQASQPGILRSLLNTQKTNDPEGDKKWD
jgi:hypothetical protein